MSCTKLDFTYGMSEPMVLFTLNRIQFISIAHKATFSCPIFMYGFIYLSTSQLFLYLFPPSVSAVLWSFWRSGGCWFICFTTHLSAANYVRRPSCTRALFCWRVIYLSSILFCDSSFSAVHLGFARSRMRLGLVWSLLEHF